jgi:glycosyltransferase involved in cell wall biosynthesis
LPDLIQRASADVLLSTGNFALMRSPVPQVLLSRNSIYLSNDFYRDLRKRHEYRMWADTHFRAVLAKRSIRKANITVAPSLEFARELTRWSGREVLAIHHGFDPDHFKSDTTPLAAEIEDKLRCAEGCVKILFVSHYNYYRNFETLIRALPILRSALPGRGIKLLLTCRLLPDRNPGSYKPESAAKLVRELGVSDMIVELGEVPYSNLHRLYERADVYVTPAYAETFAHPLLEAMSSRLPVVASDIAVHREICADAGLFFARLSPEDLAMTVAQVVSSPQVADRMRETGIERSRSFSWKTHVEKILQVCETLEKPGVGRNPSVS